VLDAVVRSLGTVLEPEDLERVRQAFTLATAYIDVHEPEFAAVQPRRLRTRLAHLLIRLACEGERDCETMSEQALSALRRRAPAAAERASGSTRL
jgi:hypothetical protein